MTFLTGFVVTKIISIDLFNLKKCFNQFFLVIFSTKILLKKVDVCRFFMMKQSEFSVNFKLLIEANKRKQNSLNHGISNFSTSMQKNDILVNLVNYVNTKLTTCIINDKCLCYLCSISYVLSSSMLQSSTILCFSIIGLTA